MWGEVPNIDNDSALIRVSDASDSTKSDVSDSVFTIEKTTDVVMVTPNGWRVLECLGYGTDCLHAFCERERCCLGLFT